MRHLRRIRTTSRVVLVALAFLASQTTTFAQAPVLGVSGQAFTVNGIPQFVVFFSYFGAIRDDPATFRATLQYARSKGFNGIRMFPNWWADEASNGVCHYDPTPLFRADGSINDTTAPQFLTLLDIAAQEGMLVDVSLAMEPVQGLQFAQYQQAIGTLAYYLSVLSDGYRHVLLDLQNEYDVANICKIVFSDSQIAQLAATVRANDQLPGRFPGSHRLITGSRSGVGANPRRETEPPFSATANCGTVAECQVVESAVIAGVEIVADHDFRAVNPPYLYNWWDGTFDRVSRLKYYSNLAASLGYGQRPVYQQEPGRECSPSRPGEYCFSTNGQELVTAVTGAKRAGAAAWTFHTQFLFRWPSIPNTMTTAEQNFVNRMATELANIVWNP